MHVLFLISSQAKISELKKISLILEDLIDKNYYIYLLNTIKGNQEAHFYLKQHQYYHYQIIEVDKQQTNKDIFELIHLYPIEKIIVLGLSYFDSLSYYLDKFIGTNIDLYIVVPSYRIKSDASFFINQGAYLYNHIDDLGY